MCCTVNSIVSSSHLFLNFLPPSVKEKKPYLVLLKHPYLFRFVYISLSMIALHGAGLEAQQVKVQAVYFIVVTSKKEKEECSAGKEKTTGTNLEVALHLVCAVLLIPIVSFLHLLHEKG